VKLTKELNQILGIKTKLSTVFHPQIDDQMERMNQKLEQYLRIFVDYRQKDWPEWLVSVEFAINIKVHSATKISPFIVNYRRDLKMGIDIRTKRKMEKVTKFAERMKKVQEEAGVALKKAQEKIKIKEEKKQKYGK